MNTTSAALQPILAALAAIMAFTTAAGQGAILTYHAVGGPSGLTHAVSSEAFVAGLDELISAGARFVTVSEFTAAVADGGLVVAVTFDDGDASVIDVAWPLLAARGLPATVFVLAERIGREGSLGADDLRTLAAAGWEIASHGAAHAFYPDLSEASIAADVRAGSAALAAITGTAPACFAFPFGGHDARVEQIVARYHPCWVGSAPGVANGGRDPLPRPAASPLDGGGLAWRLTDGRDPLALALAALTVPLLLPSDGLGAPPPFWTPTDWRTLGGGRLALRGSGAGVQEALAVREGAWALHAWRGFGAVGGAAIGGAVDVGGVRLSGAWLAGEGAGVGVAVDLGDALEVWVFATGARGRARTTPCRTRSGTPASGTTNSPSVGIAACTPGCRPRSRSCAIRS